ncbi:BTAD domain-containing putative transcriptional regulator [Catellatospora sp. KI3]|uniref:AfsR/SARP family transcriptional regulator n=1 Tax=Catellatospora sp. KI3 TaxID=3041620 RepID=UPI002482AC8D|nr:AfsR/SARP family transcriptional regulator [Catellatospora sp. KI3]MDI1464696.1 BTAD domain-containing putative transcriptional regulator [Catellatospora sp. KI3]
MIEFAVLGPLTIKLDGRPVTLATPKLRQLLVMLLASAGRPVAADVLAHCLWGAHPPKTARKSLMVYVSRLRTQLGKTDRIEFGPAGYTIALLPGELDAQVFEQLLADAGAARTAGDAHRATTLLRQALELWRGDAYFDAPDARAEHDRLEELRLTAFEDLIDAELGAGRHTGVITELAATIAAHPYRERPRGQLMLALYRSGRQAEALAVYRDAHERFTEDLGLEPLPPLQQLQQQILHADPALDAPATAAAPRFRFLPRNIPDFTGRDGDLRWLDEVAQQPGNTAVITAIAGTAGVGKTALAVHWAHGAAARFPDGQLYLNLRGYDRDHPLRPIDAVTHLLLCLDVPADAIPVAFDDAVARFRDTVAGKRMLIVLDNASTAKQVRPLLPGEPGCLVVVTSRDRLSGLVAHDGAQRLTLGLLPPAESVELLRRVLGKERVDADLAHMRELADLCAHLPLALRIAAAQLADQPDLDTASYVAALRARSRVAALALDDDEDLAVRSVLDQSCHALSPADQAGFRMLGAFPGVDVTADSVAALAGTDPEAAARLLERLAAGHLLDEHAPGRFTWHDLIGDYTRTVLEERAEDVGAPLRRLLADYTGRAEAANGELLSAHEETAARARAWLERERRNLVECVARAAELGWGEAAARLAVPLWRFLHFAGHTTDWVAMFERAVAASDGIDEALQASVLNALGGAYIKAGRYGEAITIHERCVGVRTALGDHAGVARSYANLALSYEHQGRYDDALAQVRHGLDAARRAGDRAFTAAMLSGSLPTLYLHNGQIEQAREILRTHLPEIRADGSDLDVARALHNLAEGHCRAGEPELAMPLLTEAREIAERTGDRHQVMAASWILGNVMRDTGRPQEAVDLIEQALAEISFSGSRGEEVEVRNDLALSYAQAGAADQAVAEYRRSVALAREIGTRHFEATAHAGLARLLRGTDPGAADDHLAQALRILDQVNPPEAARLRSGRP